MATMPNEVVVHPLVLLSVVDHYYRVAKDTNRRVVGILLGESRAGKIDITNSYAVPFEEDSKDKSIWFLDHDYHENMYDMFKKVNAREKVVGWYSTGPKIRPADLAIHEVIRRYTANPAFVVIDVNPRDQLEVPTQAYLSLENTAEQKSVALRQFAHLPSSIGAYEAEEVGVEHLLRELRDTTASSLTDRVAEKLSSLKGLQKRMLSMAQYLENVEKGKMPANHQILYNMQSIFNLSPNLNVQQVVDAFHIKSNDNHLVIYLSSLIRSIIALHNLIDNKIANREAERARDDAVDKKKAAADKKKKDAADKENKKKEGESKKGEDALTPAKKK